MKMKKQAIQLGVGLVLLGAAIAAYLLLSAEEDVVEEAPPQQDTYVLGGATQPFVKSVSIQNAADGYVIENDAQNAIHQENNDTTYSIPGLNTDTLNQSMLKSVMTAAANLPAKATVAAAGDLSLYGLDAPAATLEITYENSTAQLTVGGEAPGGEGTYVSNGDGQVYLVESSRLTYVTGSRLSFVSRTLTPGNGETAQFTRIALSGSRYEEPIVIEEQPDSETSAILGTATYQISSPIQANADYQSAITALNSIYGLTGTDVVDVAGFLSADAAAYGLAEEDVYVLVEVVTLNNEEEDPIPPFSVAFSTPGEDGALYAQSSLEDYVYRVSASSLLFLDLELFDYQEKLIVLPHIDQVAQVEVLADGALYTFELEGEGDDLTVRIDGDALDMANFRNFYQTLISARYEEPYTPAEDGADSDSVGPASTEGEPVLRFTYRYRDGAGENAVSFWSGPSRRAIVSLDGGPRYLVQSVYVDRVLEDLPKVIAGEKVSSYL